MEAPVTGVDFISGAGDRELEKENFMAKSVRCILGAKNFRNRLL